MDKGILMGIDEKINAFFGPIADAIFAVIFYAVPVAGHDITLILAWLVIAAVFFTVYLGFINVRYFGHAIQIVRGKFDRDSDDGRINSFQALMTSMSGTVGLGNIAGVAVAVTAGGPGAVFWMMVLAFFGMSSKFAEVTLGVKYRTHASKEHPERISGGPMYYLRDGLANKGLAIPGKILAVIFAICCVLGGIGGGVIFQANQAFEQVYNVTGGAEGFFEGRGWVFGVGVAFLVGIVIIGGIKSIAAVSSRLVPVMAVIYVVAGLTVIGMNYATVPDAVMTILREALTPEAGFGGILGALLVGAQRAAFSNEAGLGTAPIIYAAAKAHNPVTQGMASMLGPFIDTILICSVTGLLIVVSGVYQEADGIAGVELTSRALSSEIWWFPYVLVLSVFLFAYSTMIAFSYTVCKGLTFLTGENDKVEMGFKIFYCLCVVVGAAVPLESAIAFTDAMFLSMCFPNIIGLYILAPEIKRDTKAYIAKLKQS